MKRLLSSFGAVCLLAAASSASAQTFSVTGSPTSVARTWPIGEVQQILTGSGGLGPFTFTVTDPSKLPPGTSLRTDLPSWAPPGASAGIIGVATTPGIHIIPLQVTNGTLTNTHTLTLTIAALTIKSLYQLPDGFVGLPYSHQFTALNTSGTVSWSVPASPPLPPGLTLSAGGLLSGTSVPAGFYNFTIGVTDASGNTVYRGFSLAAYDLRITTDGQLPNATVNEPYTADVDASGGTPPYRFTTNNLPTGLVLDELTGAITGTVTCCNGRWGFSMTVTDATHVASVKSMAIGIVSTPPTLPSITPHGQRLDDCTLGVNCNRALSSFSGGVPPFSWTATGLPPGMSIRFGSGVISSWLWPGDGELWGVATTMGDFNVQVTVTDASGATATNVFPFRIVELEQTDYPAGGRFQQPYSQRLRVIGGTGAYTVAMTAGRLPLGLTLDPATLTVSGTPLENGWFNAEFVFTDTAPGGGRQLRNTNYFFIAGDPAAPTTIQIHSSDLGIARPGQFYSTTLNACCLPAIAWEVESGSTLPAGLALSATGVLSGTPTAAEGTYAFSVRAYDPVNLLNAAVRQLTLKVSPFFIYVTAPVFPYTGNVGATFTMTFSSTGGTEPVTYALAPYSYPPAGLAISGNSLTGIPQFSGQFNFQIIGTDSAGRSALVYASVSIYPTGVLPPLNLTTPATLGLFQIGQITYPLNATGGTGIYRYSLAPGAPEIPGVRVQDGQPLPTFFGTATGGLLGVVATPGVYNTRLRVTDSSGAFFDKNVTLTVTSLSIRSQFTGPKAALGVPYSFTLLPYGGSGNYGWSATNLPPGLGIDTFTGQIAGTPTTPGTYFVNLTLTDISSAGPDRIFSSPRITVDPFEIVTPAVLPMATAGVPFSHTFAAPGCPACVWSISSTPFGLTFDPGTRTLSGTPGFPTSLSFTVVANGGTPASTVQKLVTLFVKASTIQPLSFTTQSVGPSTVGNSISASLSASGGSPPYNWAIVGGSLPPGTVFGSAADGAHLSPGITHIVGRTMQTGSHAFTLQVTDSLGNTATRTLTWTVSALASLYSTLPLTGSTLRYNQPYTQPLLVIGGSSRYTWSASGLPSGLLLDAATGVISGTPLNTGFYSVPVAVSDDLGHTLSTFVFLNIASSTPTTVSFLASPNLGTVSVGTSQSFSLGPTGGTAPYAVTLASGSTFPPGFALLTGDAVTFGAPGANVIVSGTAVQPGTYPFTLILQDSAVPPNVGGRTFTLVVSPLSLLTSTLLRDGAVGTPYAQSLVALSAGGAVSWSTAAGSALPLGLTLAADGLLSGTPTVPGTYTFQASATEGSAVRTFSFSLKVSAIGIDGPSILPSATVGAPYSYTFTNSGGASSPLVWSQFGLPPGLTLSTGGVISGAPSSGGFLFNVTVTVSDGTNSMTRRFGLPVRTAIPQPLNGPLSLGPFGGFTVGQIVNVSVGPSGGVGPYTVTLAPGSVLPPDLALIEGTQTQPTALPGSVVLAGIIRTAGTFTFTLVFSDSEGRSTERTYTLNTTPIVLASSTVRPITAGVPYSQQLTATGGTGPYTFTATPSSPIQDALPPGISLSPSGLLSGTTTSTGSYGLLLRIVDTAGASLTRLLFLPVSTPTNLRIGSANPSNVSAGTGVLHSLFATSINPATVFSWSVAAGTLPPGVTLQPHPSIPAQMVLSGAPSDPGTYVFTLRATDTTTSLGFADRVFTFRVSPMQLVQPAQALLDFADLPSATRGVLYSARFKAAGGQPPYSFTVAASTPLPAGLTLAFDGTLAGTPTQSGLYAIAVVVTDAGGATYFAPSTALQVAPSGVPPAMFASGVTTMGMASVGVPFRFPLNVNRGGVAPFSWSVAAGSSLPPGMAIYAGSNGVPDFLSGVPTTPGNYSFSAVLTDAAGQSLAMPLALTVSNLSVMPASLGPGMVGAPFSVTFTPGGGTGPYTVTASPQWDMPPGLSLTGDTLSGTPTIAGSFLLGLNVSDSTSQTLFRVLAITIDNALGEAPAVSLSPAAIALTYIQSSPDPGPVLVNVASTSGAIPYALAAEGIGGTTTGTPPGPTPSATAVDFHLSSRAVGTYTGLLAVHSASAANLVASVPVTLTVLPQPPCSYSLAPSSGSTAATAGAGSFSLNTGSTCAWTATSPDSWITLTGTTTGTGAASIGYSVSPNAGTSARSGTIAVGGLTYTLTQFGSSCSFAIAPASLDAPATGGTATVDVTASSGSCGWTASGLSATPASGSGNGSVTLVIPANTSPLVQGWVATIAGLSFTVIQEGVNCAVTLGATSAAFTDAGGTGSLTIGTGATCNYATTSAPSWVTLNAGASGKGPGTLLYTVAANSATSPRTGAVIVGGKTFSISQAAAGCSVTLDTSALSGPLAAAGGTAAVGVTTNGSACAWTAVSGASWISVAPPASNGTGVALLTLTSNLSSSVGRSGTVTVGGQTVSVTQSGTACTFALQSSAGSAPAGGGAGAVGVIAPAACAWSASSSDPSWLQPGGSGGSGTSGLDFVVQPNTDPSAPRTGVLTVAGLAYSVTQAPATCSYTLPISTITVASGGVSAASFITLSSAVPACSPAPVSYSGWLTIGGTSFAAGTGTVTYSAAPNPLGLTRRGTIQIGAQTFTVTQLGAACGYSLAEYGRLFSRAGGSSELHGSPSALGCAPAYGTDQPSFVTLGALSGPTVNIFTLPYSVSPFSTSLMVATRFAKITFGGQLFTIKQVSW